MTGAGDAALYRYTVVYEGDPTGVRILNGEPAAGLAVTVCSGDAHADLRQAQRDLAAARVQAEAKDRRIAELEEALAPFARIGALVDASMADDCLRAQIRGGKANPYLLGNICAGDLRRAARTAGGPTHGR